MTMCMCMSYPSGYSVLGGGCREAGDYRGLTCKRVGLLLLLLDNVVGRKSAMILGTIDERAGGV